MHNASLGTLAWGVTTRGRLSGAERLRMARQGIAAVLVEHGRRAFKRLGLLRAESKAAASVEPPATGLAKSTLAVASRACAPWLLNHCLRTYVWGAVLAARDGLSYDAEILYVASLLHDLGITEAFATEPGTCFALHGAATARDLLLNEGAPPARAGVVAEAIALHLNVAVGLEHGVEAHLLRAATALDVIGQRAAVLSSELVAAVLDRHPRLDCKRHLAAVTRAQAKQSPATRIGFLYHRLALPDRIRTAPFPG